MYSSASARAVASSLAAVFGDDVTQCGVHVLCHLYVCGDATQMAKDVHAALRDVIAEHGGKSAEDAEAYLAQLVSARRYSRDIY